MLFMVTSDHQLWKRDVLFNYLDQSYAIENDPVLLPALLAQEAVFEHAVGIISLICRKKGVEFTRR
jgi:hypothetical protein